MSIENRGILKKSLNDKDVFEHKENHKPTKSLINLQY